MPINLALPSKFSFQNRAHFAPFQRSLLENILRPKVTSPLVRLIFRRPEKFASISRFRRLLFPSCLGCHFIEHGVEPRSIEKLPA
jgi:hypothetical protein